MLGDAIAPRWNVTAAPLAILEDVYVKEAYPSVEVRGSLANHLGITTRQVQVWFQNRRSKAKMQEDDWGSCSEEDLNLG